MREAIDRLVDLLTAENPDLAEVLVGPGWRDALYAAPRHLFLPAVLWRRRGRRLVPLDTGGWSDRQRWDVAYDDGYIVTQVDDGTPAEPDGTGLVATCAISQPSLVLRMLAALEVRPGMRVLEIGTGTGWNTGLLAARLGSGNVVSVEIDEQLAAEARAALAGAGLRPRVVAGDGALGFPPEAPYDRVIATCAVRSVPAAWLAQTRPGGGILTPWAPTFDGASALLRLTVHDDGGASGPFLGDCPFMWLRADRPFAGEPDDLVDADATGEDTDTSLDPRTVTATEAARFVVGVQVPGCRWVTYRAADDAPDAGSATTWLADGSGSWAAVDYDAAATRHRVTQAGPRRLWDEVEAAWHWWTRNDRPGIDAFGMTVGADGQAIVWYHTSDGPNWPVKPALLP